jgi:NAD(P)-dependent dehydrogenase (short-subunit alcohol dehydrogenase family)
MRQVLDHFHRLDILVNNAGILEMGTIETTSMEQYDRIMNTNVRAVYHMIMLAAPHLAETRGNIVNVSSVNGIRSFPGVLAYNVSKAAVDQERMHCNNLCYSFSESESSLCGFGSRF